MDPALREREGRRGEEGEGEGEGEGREKLISRSQDPDEHQPFKNFPQAMEDDLLLFGLLIKSRIG